MVAPLPRDKIKLKPLKKLSANAMKEVVGCALLYIAEVAAGTRVLD